MIFQSTHLREVRLIIAWPISMCLIISIHAPTWGATTLQLVPVSSFTFQSTHLREVRHRSKCGWCTYDSHFNPRTYVRCDTDLPLRPFPYRIFQSTHLREVRLGFIDWIFNFSHFNPRTYVRCDPPNSFFKQSDNFISIHAPTWGATTLVLQRDFSLCISIHAPTWGATW